MKQRRFGVYFALISLGVLLLFQNCGPRSNMNSGENAAILNLCPSGNCADGADHLQVKIGNADPVMLLVNEYSFDLGGYCDNGGFAATRIYYEIRGATPKAMTLSGASCDARGRWRVLVTLPANFAHNQSHTVYVEIKGVDSAGQEVSNPTGLNHKEISIASYIPPQ